MEYFTLIFSSIFVLFAFCLAICSAGLGVHVITTSIKLKNKNALLFGLPITISLFLVGGFMVYFSVNTVFAIVDALKAI